MHEKSEFLSWVEDPSMKVSNGSMFLDHLVKLELLQRFGLKNSTFTPGVPTLLGFQMFLSTDALLYTAPVTISFGIIVLSEDKLFRKSSTRKFFQTFMTRFCPMTPMTAGLKRIGLTDNLRILSIM